MIYLVRHGDVDLDDNGIFDGWMPVPLNAKGREQAEGAGKKLHSRVQRIVSSDILRAFETAGIVNQYLSLSIKTDDGLRPIDVGEFTGKSKDSNWDEFKKYIANPDLRIPGGESSNDFHKRVAQTVRRYQDGIPTALVTHNSFFASAANHLYTPDEDEVEDMIEPGGVAILTSTGKLVKL